MLTICNNIICCEVLISHKLLTAHAQARPYALAEPQERSLLWVLTIVVESAAIYVAWSVVYLATLGAHLAVENFFAAVWPVVAGIAFMLINVRVGAGWGKHGEHQISGGVSQFMAQQGDLISATYEMTPVAVNVTTVTEHNGGSVTCFKPESLERTI